MRKHTYAGYAVYHGRGILSPLASRARRSRNGRLAPAWVPLPVATSAVASRGGGTRCTCSAEARVSLHTRSVRCRLIFVSSAPSGPSSRERPSASHPACRMHSVIWPRACSKVCDKMGSQLYRAPALRLPRYDHARRQRRECDTSQTHVTSTLRSYDHPRNERTSTCGQPGGLALMTDSRGSRPSATA